MNELELLELAKTIMELNKELNPMLTGSLMLYVRGINKRREANDIDILVNIIDYNKIAIPDGFDQSSPCYPDVIQFKNKDGIKIDFLLSEETSENIDGINCGSTELMLNAKYMYYMIENSDKHKLDLEFLNYDFPILEVDILPY